MKKRKLLALQAEPYEELQALVKLLGWPNTWLASEIDKMIAALLIVAKQAIQDAEERKGFTEAEAKKRYEDMMRLLLEKKR